jgi:hypothetical protein
VADRAEQVTRKITQLSAQARALADLAAALAQAEHDRAPRVDSSRSRFCHMGRLNSKKLSGFAVDVLTTLSDSVLAPSRPRQTEWQQDKRENAAQ